MTKAVVSVQAYLEDLPPDRRTAIESVRRVILDSLNPGFEEGIQYGMLAYYVPHSVYPKGYHANPKLPLPCISLASQKSHMAVYLMCINGGSDFETWFREAWAKSGKKLDMGKSCVRFKKLEDVALDVLGETLKRVTVEGYVASYEASLATPRAKPAAAAKRSTKKKAAAPTIERAPKKQTTSKHSPTGSGGKSTPHVGAAKRSRGG